MPHALAFFPWIAQDQPLTIGDLRLLPYHAGERKNTLPHVTQADLNAIFKSYRNRPREPVRQGTITEVGDWQSGLEIDAAMEDFIANDPFGPEMRPRRSPWAEVQSKTRGRLRAFTAQ